MLSYTQENTERVREWYNFHSLKIHSAEKSASSHGLPSRPYSLVTKMSLLLVVTVRPARRQRKRSMLQPVMQSQPLPKKCPLLRGCLFSETVT
jgi:hypothetical protein